MRRAVPLYEFMPYGAPDLIESRRRHQSLALLLASASALVLYALSTGLAALIPAPVAELKPMISIDPQAWELIAPRPPAPAPPLAKPRPPVSEHAPPVALPDAVAPAPEPTARDTDQPTVTGAAGPATASDALTTVPGPETLPARLDWVYVENMPKALKEVKPEYPEIAVQAGVEGAVDVFVLVGTDGRVLKAELSEKVQVLMLNEAALAAARQWVFTPGLANGKPVACWTAIPFRFRLH